MLSRSFSRAQSERAEAFWMVRRLRHFDCRAIIECSEVSLSGAGNLH